MFKKFSVLMVIIMIASMILAACGGGKATEADCAKPEVFCIGLVTDVGEDRRQVLQPVSLGRCTAGRNRAWWHHQLHRNQGC